MAALQTSGQISINNLRNHFGDSGTSGLSEFYRGGSLVPSVRLVREPAVGDYYTGANGTYSWSGDGIYWNGSFLGYSGGSSLTIGAITYFQGTFRESIEYTVNVGDNDDFFTVNYYGIYRMYYITINTGIPSSGTISLSQFYGAENS